MTAGRICTRSVDTVAPDESVLSAARRMSDRNVGTLVVANSNHQPLGILTDRDLVTRVLARGIDPVGTTVRQVMTRDVEAVTEDSSMEDALRLMRSGGYRRVPVVNAESGLVGILSLDDILKTLAADLGDIGRVLKDQSPAALAEIP
jgi:CBS domain-containing protein